MADRIISKDRTGDWIETLRNKQAVVAPVERENAPAEFREIEAGDRPILDGSKPMMNPKDYLLPRYEVMFKATTGGESGPSVETTVPEARPTVILGMWLCDAQAIRVLDHVFLDGPFKDPYYAARRENTALVAVIPAKTRWSWFCTSVGDVSEWKKNVDAVMYDLGDRFYIESVTQRGEDLLDGSFFSEPSESDVNAKDEVWARYLDMPRHPFAGDALFDNLEWENPIWGDIADRCISCGACTYMCPSCSCFDIQDDVCGNCTERYRCRDTCQFEDFTLMGAGHNPRHQQLPRSRQRLLHKFKYQPLQFGLVGCTGCGRCVEVCPVNIDIRDILTRTCAEERKEEATIEG